MVQDSIPINSFEVARRQDNLTSTALHGLGIERCNSSAIFMRTADHILHLISVQLTENFICEIRTICILASVCVRVWHLDFQQNKN